MASSSMHGSGGPSPSHARKFRPLGEEHQSIHADDARVVARRPPVAPRGSRGVRASLSPPGPGQIDRSRSTSPSVKSPPTRVRSAPRPPARNIMSARLQPLEHEGEAAYERPQTASIVRRPSARNHRRTASTGADDLLSTRGTAETHLLGGITGEKNSHHRRSRTDIDADDVQQALDAFASSTGKHTKAQLGVPIRRSRSRDKSPSPNRSCSPPLEPATNVGFTASAISPRPSPKVYRKPTPPPVPPPTARRRSPLPPIKSPTEAKVDVGLISPVEAAHIAAIEAALSAEEVLELKERDAVISPAEREHIAAVAAAACADLERCPSPKLSLAEPEPPTSESESESGSESETESDEDSWDEEEPCEANLWPPTTKSTKSLGHHNFDTLAYAADVSHIPIDSLIVYGQSFDMNQDLMGSKIPLAEFVVSMRAFDEKVERWEVVLLSHLFDLVDPTGFWPVPRDYHLYSILGGYERHVTVRQRHSLSKLFGSLDDGYDSDLFRTLSIFKSIFHTADKSMSGALPQKNLLIAVKKCKDIPADVMPQVVEVIKGAKAGDDPPNRVAVLDYLAVCPAACALVMRIETK
eukprot:m.48928 g.48928  ORF g.48928 m.48928 type:complete len:582 (-) comp8934_c0_seq2:6525-8270(-)